MLHTEINMLLYANYTSTKIERVQVKKKNYLEAFKMFVHQGRLGGAVG